MDVKQYYKKLRELEATMIDPNVVVVSKETPDGGVAGVITEVPRRNACRLILEGRAQEATADEVELYRMGEAEKREKFKREQAANKVEFQLVQTSVRQPNPATTGN